MNIILALIALAARPDCPPVTAADVARTLALETPAISSTEQRLSRPAASSFTARIPGRFTAGFVPGRLDETLSWLAAQGAEVLRADTAAGFVVCNLPDPVGLALAEAPLPAGVRWLEPDSRTRAAHLPNDPYFLTEQWDKWVMYADRAWDLNRGNTNIAVVICDNGVEYTHPDLGDRFTPGSYGYDFVSNDNDPAPDNILVPEAFHGTHVAGITAATMDNARGIAGWAGIRLLAARVLNDSGSGTLSNLASAIHWAADQGARVVNMSLGSDDYSTPVAEAARYAAQRNVLLVAAAGNAGRATAQYPARLPEVICVGATDRPGGLADYSNFGGDQELVAPGSGIRSCWTGAGYGIASGTSMAAPQVAGVAALVLSAYPTLSTNRLRAVLAASAIDMGPEGWDARFGHGLVNAYRALTLAERMSAGPDAAASAPFRPAAIVTGVWRAPDWAERVEIYDLSGRGGTVTGREFSLAVGTWFVRLTAPGRTELLRLRAVR
ncbi:MAG TPA: hypothetical protein ENN51_05405 [candidate division WOR-3 bacterium]|uniref:Peptidase S8/S53 domain-containing protein n=1 Tax=candidate division WOR-3 bacterium TaxID=2052148 RepID=A0A7V0T6H0_UNCW3|nr:hypothetical protein [candidate division WOR-3 bacterium]